MVRIAERKSKRGQYLLRNVSAQLNLYPTCEKEILTVISHSINPLQVCRQNNFLLRSWAA
jgi:hypothetical protein